MFAKKPSLGANCQSVVVGSRPLGAVKQLQMFPLLPS